MIVGPGLRLHDIADMPDHNPAAASRGERSVSDGRVFWHHVNKVSCLDHGAMLCVNPQRTVWRCIECGSGAFVEWMALRRADETLHRALAPALRRLIRRIEEDLAGGEPLSRDEMVLAEELSAWWERRRPPLGRRPLGATPVMPARLEPVGTIVRVTPFDGAPFRAKVLGYDVFRSKYHLGREIHPGRFTAGTWAFLHQVTAVDDAEAVRVPANGGGADDPKEMLA